ncbi:B12-binding domain-containing radical SAM protein [candidate division KSB1 bacterium]|nr:B12-binding domain-containing radical SAM protein [candidate division KSB1 bacterium]
MKRVALIQPPIQDFFQTTIRQEPLGLAYLAAMLEQHNYQVLIIDAFNSPTSKTIPIPDELSYTRAYYHPGDISPFKLFQQFRHFGASIDSILNRIRDFQPDAIGISMNFSPYADTAMEIARQCKQELPNIPIIAGGHHAAAAPELVLKNSHVDFVILGEGEQTLLALLQALGQQSSGAWQKIAGIAFRQEGGICVNPPATFIENLDSLPAPSSDSHRSHKMLMTSRGCPKRCEFCSIHRVMGRKVRFHSIGRVLSEIRQAIVNGATHIDFEDDTFTINRDRTIALLQAIINEFANDNITFSALNGIDPCSLDEEIICLLKKTGFEWLNLPLVSSHTGTQTRIQRNTNARQFHEIISLAVNHELKVVAYIILGLPDDTIDDMIEDILFLSEQQVLIGPSIFYPPPGTPIYETCIQRGYIKRGDMIRLRSSAIPVETEQFTRTDIVTLFRLVRMLNYIKSLADDNLTENCNLLDFITTHFENPDRAIFPQKLSRMEIGIRLLHKVVVDKQLTGLSMQKITDNSFHYTKIPYNINDTIVKKMVDQLQNRRIVGVQNSIGIIVSRKSS